MGKYIYASKNDNLRFNKYTNGFNDLCFCLGAWIELKERGENEFQNYLNYINENSLHHWHFVNKAHNYIKAALKDEKSNTIVTNKDISKREMRRLGYSGYGSLPKYPKSGDIIRDVFFDILFNSPDLTGLDKQFTNYIYEKWIDCPEMNGFISVRQTPPKDVCIQKTSRNFVGFQFNTLRLHLDYRNKILNNESYKDLYYSLQNEYNTRNAI